MKPWRLTGGLLLVAVPPLLSVLMLAPLHIFEQREVAIGRAMLEQGEARYLGIGDAGKQPPPVEPFR